MSILEKEVKVAHLKEKQRLTSEQINLGSFKLSVMSGEVKIQPNAGNNVGSLSSSAICINNNN